MINMPTNQPSRRRRRPSIGGNALATASLVIYAASLSSQGRGVLAQTCDIGALTKGAEKVIRSNYNKDQGWTAPSSACSPYLSSSDSLFAAYAYSHFDPEIGMQECKANLAGQWPNGLIPRIRFPPEAAGETWLNGTIFPGPSVWRAPADVVGSGLATAGIAAPPWHAIVAMQLFNQRRDDAALDFVAQVFGPIYRYHRYLHQVRNAQNGLVYSYHPWESELPYDSPIWTKVLKDTQSRINANKWKPSIDYTQPAAVPSYPGEEIFNAEIFLVELLADLMYDDVLIQSSSPFIAIDVEFNSILAAADVNLQAMAKVLQLHSSNVLGDTAKSTINLWVDSSVKRLEFLWAGDRYASYLLSPKAQPTAPQANALTSSAAVAAMKDEKEDDVVGEARAIKKIVLGRGGRRSGSTSASQSPAPVPMPEGEFFPLPIVSNFWPLYVGGLPSARFQGLLFQIITPGIATSFDCQDYVYRLPTSACLVHDPAPEVSLLHNFVVQRGLAANGDVGFNKWLLNETFNLVCNASMDPFSAGKASGPFLFSRFFDPVNGQPLPDMFGQDSTMAAALMMTLLFPDALNGSDAPPISHDVTFALVVVELIIAFATGVGCFVFSLNVFRKLSVASSDRDAPISMLNVHELDDEYNEDGEGGHRLEGGSQYQTFGGGTGTGGGAGGDVSRDHSSDDLRLRRTDSGGGPGSENGGLYGAAKTYASYLKFW